MRAALSVGFLGLMLVFGTGCGSSDGGDSGGGESGDNGLTVALASVAADAPNRIAYARGLFEKNGVDVTLQEETGSNTPNLVASGDVDLGSYTVSGPAVLESKGRDVSLVYGTSDGSLAGNVFVSGKPGAPKRLEEIGEDGSCRIASQATGTASYRNAVKFNEEYDLGCEVSPLADPTSQTGSVAAGNVDAVVGSYSNFVDPVEAGKLSVVVNSSKPEHRKRYFADNWVNNGMFGLKERLEEKADLLPGYMKALDEASKILLETPTDELVEELKDLEGYRGLTEEAIATSIDEYRAHFQEQAERGYITEEDWENTLAALDTFGIAGFDSGADEVQYDRVVDMSYLEEALGGPPSEDSAAGEEE